jgi:hypothetical protein
MNPETPTTRSKTTPRFYACVALLLVAAAGMQISAGVLQGYFQKMPLPLKRPLHLLDVARLAPQYVLHRNQPAPLSPEMIDTLGTEEYIQWNLVDRQVDRDAPTAVARLFVTYHTGGLTMVPHRPQECMSAAGMILRNEEVVQVTVQDSHGRPLVIPLDVLEFEVPPRELQLGATGDNAARMYVAYFFFSNGKYMTSRTQVRAAISNFTDKYAYYSKIELSFNDDNFRRMADRNETVEAAGRLLQKVMPVLWDDHYQDWDAILTGAAPAASER